MRPEELRVGNIILGNGKIITVTDIRRNELVELGYKGSVNGDVSDDPYRSNEAPWLAKCSGIPLTEEWLIKFGFSYPKNQSSFYWIKLSASLFNINPDNGVVWINNPVGEPFNNPALIEYVHQLQNLYFALMGHELIIKTEREPDEEWKNKSAPYL